MSNIIDISLPISANMPTYPGTTPTQIREVRSGSGTSVLSEISLTSHAGTHIDAPSHSVPGTKSIDALPLDLFYGPCRVLDLTACKEAITEADLQAHAIQKNERVLFKTSNSLRDFDAFFDDYIYLEAQAARYLSDLGVLLVGIDSLSIKQRGAPDNTAHTALLSKDIPILEGIRLGSVEPGNYTLIAFPLAFRDIDGSPVRAILTK
jgi:arylformamidase